MKSLLHCLKSKVKKNKVMIGKKVRLVRSISECRSSSSNKYIGSCDEFIITGPIDGNHIMGPAWYIKNTNGHLAGWAYEWEMEEVSCSKVVFEEKMEKLKSEMEELQRKIDFLNETGNEQFDEEEYKVYSTLKLFQNDKLTDVEKSKLIAKLIKGK